MKAITHIWRNEQIETLNRVLFSTDFNQSSMFKYLYCPMVVVYGDETELCGHWGEKDDFRKFWEAQMPSQLPEEFRLSLLIMGITL